jgi:hypothetical protein
MSSPPENSKIDFEISHRKLGGSEIRPKEAEIFET